jgi:hypothetical protein
MLKSTKRRQIIALSAGVAVGLSATSIVLLQDQANASEGAKTVQSALRDGAATAQVGQAKKPGRIQVAEKKD